jgi:hypothetical protein
MPAGREIDALVAEKVMGLPGKTVIDGTTYYCGIDIYSTSISAAWEVVEKVKETKAIWVGNERDGEWMCLIGEPNMNVLLPEAATEADGFAPSEELAICRAALKSVGVEECE